MSKSHHTAARRLVRYCERLGGPGGGAFGAPKLAALPFGAREPARVLSGDLLRPRTLRETGETVDLHRHPWFALDKKCGKLRGEDDDRMDTLDLDLDLDLKVNAHANCDDLAVRILPPVAAPPVFLGTGLNYHRHAAECGLAPPRVPILAFCKPSTALQRPGGSIAVPACCDPDVPEVDWEVELAVVIGEHRDTGELCKNATAETALDYVLGYTVANDVSARLWQTDPERTGGQWNRGKSFDTFAPLGPAMVLQERGFDPHADLEVALSVNGETMQRSHTGDMIHRVPAIVEFMSRDTTLLPGTVLLTGTPEGIGMFQDPPRYLRDGDVCAATIEGIGTLVNPVVDAAASSNSNSSSSR
jgi:2-keto-4-pentenoate hydratase/2-oxohepta-3-ene-1,7-dioic acid hydratase in catechol pathway